MKFLLFISPNEFKDESVKMVEDFFDKWGVKYSISSFSNKECIGSHGSTYFPEINTNKINISDYDGIIILDGRGVDLYKIYEFRPLLDIIYEFNKQHKYIVAINNSVKVVARANIIKDRKISLPKDEETKKLVMLFRGLPTDKEIEKSENLYTIKDPTKLDETIPQLLEYLNIK